LLGVNYLKAICKVSFLIASLFILPVVGSADGWSGWQLVNRNSGVDTYLRYYNHLGTSKPQMMVKNNNGKPAQISLNKISFSLSNGGECYLGNSSAYVASRRSYTFSASYAPCGGLISSYSIGVTVKK